MKARSVGAIYFPERANLICVEDLDKITDDLEREASIGIIHNCKYIQ